jgi:hypothetical protein
MTSISTPRNFGSLPSVSTLPQLSDDLTSGIVWFDQNKGYRMSLTDLDTRIGKPLLESILITKGNKGNCVVSDNGDGGLDINYAGATGEVTWKGITLVAGSSVDASGHYLYITGATATGASVKIGVDAAGDPAPDLAVGEAIILKTRTDDEPINVTNSAGTLLVQLLGGQTGTFIPTNLTPLTFSVFIDNNGAFVD